MNYHKKFVKYSCTGCGACSDNIDGYNTKFGYQPTNITNDKLISISQYCPGIGLNRQSLFDHSVKADPFIGPIHSCYVGFSNNEIQRLSSSSGGVLTEIAAYLLEKKFVDGIAMPIPTDSSEADHEYEIVTDIRLIRESSQSIYRKVSISSFINKLSEFNGSVCFIGLPDQVAALSFKYFNHHLRTKIKYKIGPMVGIMMDGDVIDFLPKLFRNSSGINKLRWREGEWPGYLLIQFSDGKEYKLTKFYYNYLLPFFCSYESLMSDDFSNELTDISVGDAWSPKYESLGKGWSLVTSKSQKGDNLLKTLSNDGIINLDPIDVSEAISMHAHMLDFKKRGSYFRIKILKFLNFSTPKNYSPSPLFSVRRYAIEIIILFIVLMCRTKLFRFILLKTDQKLLGRIFSFSRLKWKQLTKKTKREGMSNYGKR